MKKFFRYILVLLSLSVVTGCMTYKEVEVVKVSDVGIKNMTLKGIDIEVAMQIKNPNNYDISIVDSDLALFAEGEKVGRAQVKEKIKLKKKSNKVYRFTIQTSASEILSGAIPVILSMVTKGNIELQITGDIKAKAKGIGKRFPVNFKDRIKL